MAVAEIKVKFFAPKLSSDWDVSLFLYNLCLIVFALLTYHIRTLFKQKHLRKVNDKLSMSIKISEKKLKKKYCWMCFIIIIGNYINTFNSLFKK